MVTKTEDCLFLDIYVPASVLDNGTPNASVPVIVWFFGGAYVLGGKIGSNPDSPFYTGAGPISAANAFSKDVIFVAGNYRTGAFGWLAGSYMESAGTPNAGLYDQRLLLEWVQTYIHQVGGDNTKVSAWGQSAGAGSILHHLVSSDGQGSPLLFQRAILQSPAYEMQWDHDSDGTLDKTYNTFAQLAGCPPQDIDCLRDQPFENQILKNANVDLINSSYRSTHLFPVGPAVDGTLIKRLPVIALENRESVEAVSNDNILKSYLDNFNPNLASIMISHVEDEAAIFVPKSSLTNSEYLTTYISNFMPQPSLSLARSSIESQYALSSYSNNPTSQLNAVIRDSSFTCNTRWLFDAYHTNSSTSVYMMEYDYALTVLKRSLPAWHAMDLLPTFWNTEVNFTAFLMTASKNSGQPLSLAEAAALASLIRLLAPQYQSYLVSHAIFGDPNKGSFTEVPWSTATITASADDISNVQLVTIKPHFLSPFFTPSFTVITDTINTADGCDFWKTLASSIDPSTPSKTPAPTPPPPNEKTTAEEVKLEL